MLADLGGVPMVVRVAERAKYFKRWGIPKEVYMKMLRNY
jgi:CMP-2-keto-3-deoxyoctulosonic acid synthetase